MIHVERQTNQETRPDNKAPTSLHLFEYSPPILEYARKRFMQSDRLKRETVSIKSSYHKLEERTMKQYERLDEAEEDIYSDIINLNSSATCSKAYLRISNDLSYSETKTSINFKDRFDFFTLCLQKNTEYYQFFLKSARLAHLSKVDALGVAARMAFKENHTVKNFFMSGLPEAPDWYKNFASSGSWPEYVLRHANFVRYINSDIDAKEYKSVKEGVDQQDNRRILFNKGVTLPDEYPDWLTDDSITTSFTNNPPIDTIKQIVSTITKEYIQDNEDTIPFMEKLIEVIEQQKYFLNQLDTKLHDIKSEILKRIDKSFPKIANFADLILWIDAVPITGYIESSKQKDIKSEDVENRRKATIEKFFQTNHTGVSKETVALWLEKKLNKTGIPLDFDNPTTDTELKDLFNLLINPYVSKLGKPKPDKKANSLYEKNKKFFKIMHNDFIPLFALLPDEGKIDLYDKLNNTDNPITTEEFIWEISEWITLALQDKLKNDKVLKDNKTIKDIKQNAINWVNSNWSWAYQTLKELASDPKRTQSNTTISNDKNDEQTLLPETVANIQIDSKNQNASNGESLDVKIQSLEDDIDQLERGSLNGWHLQYAMRENADDKHLIEIGGETLQEREQAFKEFIGHEGIACTVDPEAVIRKLERILRTPQETLWQKPKQEIDGVIYDKDKMKKGMRLFTIIDPETKTIKFFIYKKKDWGYRFN